MYTATSVAATRCQYQGAGVGGYTWKPVPKGHFQHESQNQVITEGHFQPEGHFSRSSPKVDAPGRNMEPGSQIWSGIIPLRRNMGPGNQTGSDIIPHCEQKNTRENITFPQLRLQAVKMAVEGSDWGMKVSCFLPSGFWTRDWFINISPYN